MNGELRLCGAEAAALADPAYVGGKGRQLGLLRQRGLPVPDFFVIPAAWSRLADGAQGALPDALLTMLHSELAARGWLQTPLAVRSSASCEDAAAASFAGVFVSRLNVCGTSALAVAVAEVWASLGTPTAAAYRERLGLADEAAMAVVVMPLLPAVASGIAFTCDPISGREDRIVVHANWGLGETLVGGESEGDEYVFAEDTSDVWRLLECRPGRKTVHAQPAAGGGTERLPVPGARGPVRLGNVANLSIESGPAQLARYDRQRNVNFDVELNGVPLGEVEAQAMALPSLTNLPPGVSRRSVGDAEAMSDLFNGFGLAMIAGVLCIYAVLVLLFKIGRASCRERVSSPV